MKGSDMTGLRFTRWTVVGPGGKDRWNGRVWDLVCDCGKTGKAPAHKLIAGETKSCGCIRFGKPPPSKKHGMWNTRVYGVWRSMKARCHREGSVGYENYGGRGIRVCERWRGSFEAFLADMGPGPPGGTVDRIDVGGDYEPGNCRWAVQQEQNRNYRRNKLNEVAVCLIRHMRRRGVGNRALANAFGVSVAAVKDVTMYRSWTWDSGSDIDRGTR